jgi:hypothetical protein
MKHANKVNMHLNDYPFRFFKLFLFIHGELYLIQHYVIKFVSDLIQHYVIKFVSDLIQHYVIKFVSDLRQVGSFLHK